MAVEYNDSMNGEIFRGEKAEHLSATDRTASLLAEFRLRLPLLRRTFQRVPHVDVAVEQELAFDGTETLLTIYARGDCLDAFEHAMSDDGTVTDVVPLGVVGETERRYRLRVPKAHTSYWKWAEQGAVLLDAKRCEDEWTLRMRFPDRAALAEFREYCREQGWRFDLGYLKGADSHEADDTGRGLTDGQHNLLTAAFESGYFDIPRGTMMSELATEFGISDQAASERLRRGLSNHLDTVY